MAPMSSRPSPDSLHRVAWPWICRTAKSVGLMGTLCRELFSGSNLDRTDIETLVTIPLGGRLNTLALDTLERCTLAIRCPTQCTMLTSTALDSRQLRLVSKIRLASPWINEKVYWSGGAKTQQANLDGTWTADVLINGLSLSRDIDFVSTGAILLRVVSDDRIVSSGHTTKT